MFIALLIWSAIVAAAYYFGGAILDLLTPGATWLQANPELAGWITPVLGFAGTLGVSAAIIAWLAGALLIVLVARLKPGRRLREAISYDEWRSRDGDGDGARRRGFGGWRPRPYPVRGYGDDHDDDHDDRRYRRRRRRDDADDDD